MDIYRSEEEQVEALKRWWQQNGRSLIIGLALALVLVFAWRAWQTHEKNQAEIASMSYEVMLNEADPAKAIEHGRALIGSQPGSGYATLAALHMARLMLEQGDKAGAAGQLRWVMENAPLESLGLLARQRLARVQLDMGEAETALATLKGAEGAGFAASYDETRGDILLALGRRGEARAAYLEAQAGYAEVPAKQELLEMKIDDLADAGEVQ